MPASPARATLTIENRKPADGSVRWFLWTRRPRPERDADAWNEFIDTPYTRPADRPAVQEFAKPYRAALAGASTKPEPETSDEWYERFAAYREKEVGSAEDDRWRWVKWISPHIGPKPIRDVPRRTTSRTFATR